MNEGTPLDDSLEIGDKLFEFSLLNSQEGRIVTLVMMSSEKLSASEYVTALRMYASQIEREGGDGPEGMGLSVN